MSESYHFLRINDEFYGIVYTFSTPKFGYTIYFNDSVYKDLVDGYDYLSQSYSFGFFHKDLDDEKRKSGDKNISYTIIKIVEDFFQTEGTDAVILFHCDVSDSKELLRHKTFSRWYRNSHIVDFITMNTIEILIGDTTHYMGFICHQDNKHIENLKSEFEQVAKTIAPEPAKK